MITESEWMKINQTNMTIIKNVVFFNFHNQEKYQYLKNK